MKTELKNKTFRILLIPVGLFIVLVPVSMLLGWNLFTGVLYWFIAVPVLSFVLPKFIRDHGTPLIESLVGLTLFYLFMVFMIYKHLASDFFALMMVSFLFNLIAVTTIALLTKRKMPATH